MYKMQCKAQESETSAIRSQITEAKTEIESIEYEKKQLYQNWKTSLIGLRRRDDALLIAKQNLEENQKSVRNGADAPALAEALKAAGVAAQRLTLGSPEPAEGAIIRQVR